MAQEIADSTLLDTWSSGGNIVKPDISKIIEGWQLGEQPPHEYMNWLQNTFGSKLNHILKNGVASWNNTTQYLAGSSVQHTNNVWLCKTTNTNSEPTDANANWKRIITIEALENLLVGYVATTGNQTIAGVKTFSSSPIVPTPTDGTQVANKAYVDTKQANLGYIPVQQGTGIDQLDNTVKIGWSHEHRVKVTVDTTDMGNIVTDIAGTITGVKTFSSSPIVPTPTTDEQVANKAYVDSKPTLPTGTILNAYTIFDNCIVAFGGEFNRADYPKLWAYLQANPSLVKTQAEWTTENTTNGMCGFFSDGDGTTTFRVPNLDKAFLRPDSRAVGSFQGDELKSHTHTYRAGSSASGANTSFHATPWTGIYFTTDASGGNETRPKNIAVLPLIVAK